MKSLMFNLAILCLLLSSCIKDDLVLQNDLPLPESNNDVELSSDVVFSDVVKTQDGLQIQDALVTIYASNQKFAAYTDEHGVYRLSVPSELLPRQGVVSLNIIHSKYKPVTVSYIAPLDSVSVLSSNGVAKLNCVPIV